MLFWLSAALAQETPDPGTFVDPGNPAPAPAPSSGLTIEQVRGHWFVTTPIDGKEAVAWSCKGNPVTFDLDSETIMVTVGESQLGGAVRSVASRGGALVLATTLESCGGAKEVAVKWADAGKKIVEITRCEGSPRVVRAVRDVASGVPVMRQCCDASGKAVKYVASEAPCPEGSEGQKPVPLKR